MVSPIQYQSRHNISSSQHSGYAWRMMDCLVTRNDLYCSLEICSSAASACRHRAVTTAPLVRPILVRKFSHVSLLSMLKKLLYF